jgi:hypothetical protein
MIFQINGFGFLNVSATFTTAGASAATAPNAVDSGILVYLPLFPSPCVDPQDVGMSAAVLRDTNTQSVNAIWYGKLLS